jgi:chaperone required for assembly of F1-ATPase
VIEEYLACLKSTVITLALVYRHISTVQAIDASRVEESFQVL